MVRGGEEILMVVNRSPVKEMALDISFRDGKAVKRILDDGGIALAAAYGGTYRVAPGYAEIFVKKGESK
jgi:hypothetical protein